MVVGPQISHLLIGQLLELELGFLQALQSVLAVGFEWLGDALAETGSEVGALFRRELCECESGREVVG